MKNRHSASLFCMLAVLGLGLTGNQNACSAETTDTNLNSSFSTNTLPKNTLPADLDPDSAFAELIRLVQAGVEPTVILAYIDNTYRLFNLTADDIIYLTDLGTPAELIEATMEHDRELIQKGISPETASPKEVSATAQEEPPEVTEAEFYDVLTPYGSWVYIEGYGRCWRPTLVIYNSGWRPYCDNGQWVYTDYGWYWRSGYSWGWATFHYGRWFHHSHYGWCWWPDTVWAPSWVCWRYDRNYCGWAPLPPHAVYRSGVGLVYRGSTVTVGFNFGLNASAYTFVATKNFCDPKPWRHRIDDREAERIYNRTTVFHKISYDRKSRRVTNSGISPRDIPAVARQESRPGSMGHAKDRAIPGKQQERSDRLERPSIINRPSRVLPRKSTPPITSRNIQRPERDRGTPATLGRGTSTAEKSGEVRKFKPAAPQAPPIQQKQPSRSAASPQGRKPDVSPQGRMPRHWGQQKESRPSKANTKAPVPQEEPSKSEE